jgi:hypothetical protein
METYNIFYLMTTLFSHRLLYFSLPPPAEGEQYSNPFYVRWAGESDRGQRSSGGILLFCLIGIHPYHSSAVTSPPDLCRFSGVILPSVGRIDAMLPSVSGWDLPTHKG